MNFVQRIFVGLREGRDTVVVREGRVETSARDLLARYGAARAFLRKAGVGKGDRVALIGENSARWAALDLAIMAEGAICVPFYARQSPAELLAMIRDCDPKLVLCGDRGLLGAVEAAAADGRRLCLFEEARAEGEPDEPVPLAADDVVRIVYTSGTSGDAKGAMLTVGNVDFMLPRTLERLDALMAGHRGQERVFHYLPCCFAGSWVLLLTSLQRGALLVFSTDLKQLGEEMRAADPHYMLNVPLLLERLRAGLEKTIGERGGVMGWIWARPWLARWTLFPLLRRHLAPRLRALICGSAPLAEATQRFFERIGIPVLQVYGLTETTAICTMDVPGRVVPGRVGPAIDGCEMKVSDEGEILVRGPNVFPGYWGREPHEGWLATGDLGEVDEEGNWRVLGRRKNLLVLAGGHNVAPEPLELALRLAIPGGAQVVVVGDGRKHLAALVLGATDPAATDRAVAALNEGLPHYKQVRATRRLDLVLTPESGLLTANGKLRRAAIHQRFAREIEEMYR